MDGSQALVLAVGVVLAFGFGPWIWRRLRRPAVAMAAVALGLVLVVTAITAAWSTSEIRSDPDPSAPVSGPTPPGIQVGPTTTPS